MTHTNRLRKSADAFRRLTGITPAAFDRLLGELEPAYRAADAKRKARPDRQRKVELEPEDIEELFFDATERPIPRPTRGQKRFYSGKKRRHTVKTQVVV